MLRGIEIVDRSPLALYAKQLLHLLAFTRMIGCASHSV